MPTRARAVLSSAAAVLVCLACAPPVLAQQPLRDAEEDRKDQVFEAVLVSVRTDQPQASGSAKIILPSPRWWPLNRFLYVRVEAEGLVPNKTHVIHLHRTATDSSGNVTALGCFANAPVAVS